MLYELIGPACAKMSLYFSKSYSNNLDDLAPLETLQVPPKNAVDLLVEQIQAIQKELPCHPDPLTANERAFLEAAEEQYAMIGRVRRHGRI